MILGAAALSLDAARPGASTSRADRGEEPPPASEPPASIAAPAASTSTQQAEPPGQGLPDENLAIGEIVWVSGDAGYAVVYLEASFLKPEGLLFTRDREMEPTAIVEPAPVRRGRAIGLTVHEGRTASGETVVLPGREVRATLQEARARQTMPR